MLYLARTNVKLSTNRPVVGSVPTEGIALVYNQQGGSIGVTAGTKAPNQKFAGIALFQMRYVTDMNTMPKVLVLDSTNTIIAANGDVTINLGVLPLTGSTLKIVKVDGTTVDLSTATQNGTNLTLPNPSLTMIDLDGATITFRFTPTILQWKSLYGDVIAGDAPGVVYSDVGIITKGDIYTTEWDETVDWTKANDVDKHLAIGTGGKLTLVADADVATVTVIPNSTVVFIPGAGFPYLGITLD